MKEVEQRKAAKAFSEKWKGIGDEKQDTHTFWIELFQKVFGVKDATDQFKFEYRVKREAVNGKRDTTVTYIDALLPKTHVLVEQKSITVDLDSAYEQSDKQGLTPFGQAMQYNAWLPVDLRAKWIVVCNFDEFRIHDLNDPTAPPAILKLSELEDKFHALDFMIDSTVEKVTVEEEVSFKAGQLVGRLYDELWKCYKDPSSKESLHSLNVLCVRLVFCLYAEDAGIFGRRRIFHDYLAPYRERPSKVRRAILELFDVFDTPIEERDQYLEEELAEFPYVNGSLFANAKEVEIPNFTPEIINLLLEEASEGFDWSKISPTIFGAVFESTLNPETRRKGGMHYTSIENIHKVIDPLFMDELHKEFSQICNIKTINIKREKLQAFHAKLASLTFLDPACGSGNFLTETYLSLRRLENEIIRIQSHGQASFNVEGLSPTKVTLSQFYGIEINDFACAVAKTALWIAESQMLNETEDILGRNLPFFPLKTLTNIIEGNALQMKWEEMCPSSLSYILGNPPFIGHQHRTSQQVADMDSVFVGMKNYGKVDYVGAWFKKAADFIEGKSTKVSFVSTNSLFQGESVPCLWEKLLEPNGNVSFIFAYEPFSWSSEAKDAAVVTCVITGFEDKNLKSKKTLYLKDGEVTPKNINGYLVDGPNICIASRTRGLDDGRPKIVKGSQPTDGGYLFLSKEEHKEFITKYPNLEHLTKRFLGADEFINDIYRYCFWLKDAKVSEFLKNSFIKKRIESVADVRRASPTSSVREDASIPYLFTQIRQPNNDYLLIPRHTGENREYIPIGFFNKDVICGDANYLIENADLGLFALLNSSAHMAWMKTICGRLGLSYRYSPAVYNSFVWPAMTEQEKDLLKISGKKILDERATNEGSTPFEMYNPLSMPKGLLKAHRANDKLVLKLYGLRPEASESEIVGHLMNLYMNKISEMEKIATVDVAVKKVIGKKADSIPDWMEELRKQCLDGKIMTDDLISQGKARLKEEKKKAKEAEKAASKASK